MPQIAIRLTCEELAGLDRLVAERHFTSRAAAIRDALAQVQKVEEDRRIAEEYRRAYADRPPSQEEIEIGEIGAYLLGELTKDEPPWDFGEDEEEPPALTVPARHETFSEIEATLRHLLDLVRAARARDSAES
jgi:Arc/MetJ-type ribon-helix-helix transcriptional regulator